MQKWPSTAWRELLKRALPALDEFEDELDWRMGGGTALALKLGHRVSYDIDIFFEDGAFLRRLSPNRNRKVRAITDNWQEPGNYIKLECEDGEIDFISVPNRTELPPWSYRLDGHSVPVEEPVEIVAKKLHYRGSKLLARDTFDILAVAEWAPEALNRAVDASPAGARRAADRIRRRAGNYVDSIREEVNPTTTGAALLDLDPLIAATALEDALVRAGE